MKRAIFLLDDQSRLAMRIIIQKSLCKVFLCLLGMIKSMDRNNILSTQTFT